MTPTRLRRLPLPLPPEQPCRGNLPANHDADAPPPPPSPPRPAVAFFPHPHDLRTVLSFFSPRSAPARERQRHRRRRRRRFLSPAIACQSPIGGSDTSSASRR